MNAIDIPGQSPFDAIRQVRSDGSEFWSARDLCKAVEYETWRNFAAAIDRAILAAKNSGASSTEEFVQVTQLVDAGNLGKNSREDYELSRFAAYLVVMNGDPRKPAIASAQSYFAIRTRQAEVVESKLATALDVSKRQMELMQLAQAHRPAPPRSEGTARPGPRARRGAGARPRDDAALRADLPRGEGPDARRGQVRLARVR